MAQVSLKSYENEIRNFIDSKQFDEAMSTGQHILQYYPKHLQTYSLLGEVCLATGRFEEAADTMMRVLSVDPENVAARLGLSEAHEATGDLPGAIEQMRIAFDLAPSTRAMHEQMHRLLKLQQGEPVPKLKLTRQGLGRIYMRGELYTQAADEFEALLRENPDQVDVEVSLAEALWQDGQHIRSIEVCQSVLNKLPYCLKAHLILAETWQRSDREDQARAHLRIVKEIDPDGEVSHSLLGDESPMPRADVSIPSVEDPAPPREPTEAGAAAGTISGDGETTVSDIDVSDIPEWLRQARPEEADDETITDADVPAWLTAGAVAAGLVDQEESSEDAESEESVPAWLRPAAAGDILQDSDIEEITELDDLVEASECAEEGTPQWRHAAPEAPVMPDEEPGAAPVGEPTSSGDALPPWLDELDTGEEGEDAAVSSPIDEEERIPAAKTGAEGEEPPVEQADVPSWMQNLLLEQSQDDEAISEPAPEPEESIELPPWMHDIESSGSAESVSGVQPGDGVESDTGNVAGATAEAAERETQEPEWLRILREEGSGG